MKPLFLLTGIPVLMLSLLPSCKQPVKTAYKDSPDTCYVLQLTPFEEKAYLGRYSEKDLIELLYPIYEEEQEGRANLYIDNLVIVPLQAEDTEEGAALRVFVSLAAGPGIQEPLYTGVCTEEFHIKLLDKHPAVVDYFRRPGTYGRQDGETAEAAEHPEKVGRPETGFPTRFAHILLDMDPDTVPELHGILSEEDVLKFLYLGEAGRREADDTARITNIQAFADSFVGRVSELETSVIDSGIVVLTGFTMEDPESDFWGHWIGYYELAFLEINGGTLSVRGREQFGPYRNKQESPVYRDVAGLKLATYRISESASAFAVTEYACEEEDLTGSSYEYLFMHVVDAGNGEITRILELSMDEEEYEHSVDGEGEDHTSRMTVEAEFEFTGELVNGFYKIRFIDTLKDFIDGELIKEESATEYYIWDNGYYTALSALSR